MSTIFNLIPIILYFIVGIICFIMAKKSIFSGKFLPFHEAAAGKRWEELDERLRMTFSTILKVSGLGFFVVGLLLTIIPIVTYFSPNDFLLYAVPIIALIYCMGLFWINYMLYKSTGAATPWKRSLYAAIVLVIGIVMTILQ